MKSPSCYFGGRAVSVLTLNPWPIICIANVCAYFLAMLGVPCLMGCFSSCADGSHFLIVVCASHVVDSRVEQGGGCEASVAVAPALLEHGLSSCRERLNLPGKLMGPPDQDQTCASSIGWVDSSPLEPSGKPHEYLYFTNPSFIY